jgi:AcrR family transcriptional regulator
VPLLCTPYNVAMAAPAQLSSEPRTPLSKERVLRAAVALADAGGIESLSMRKLAQELGVEAMSLYNHVRNKEDLLDGMVDVVVGEIDLRPSRTDWKSAIRGRIIAARKVLLRHTWAPRVIESRINMSGRLLRYMESLLALFRGGGFSVDQTHHALHVLGSRVLGFNQDLFEDSSQLDASPEVAAIMAREMAQTYPYITEMALAVSHAGGLGGCDDDEEFAFGLDLILDGLERLLYVNGVEQLPTEKSPPRPELHLDPLVALAIDDLRQAAAHSSDGPELDPKLRRQIRATLVELLDAVLEDPRPRAARRAALVRRRGKRTSR